MSTVQNMESKASGNWSSLETLEHSRYKTEKNSQVGTGSRPTVKNLKQLDSSTSSEDKIIREASLKADKDVQSFINKIDRDEQDIKKANAIKKQIASLNTDDVDEPVRTKVVPEAKLKESVRKSDFTEIKESPQEMIKEIFLGFGRLYINKTNNILNPLRFVVDNKTVVLRAILLFIIPAIMTWFFTSQVNSIQMELAKENMLVKAVYAVIFYFASMFVLFTALITGSGLWNGIMQSLRNAQKVGKN